MNSYRNPRASLVEEPPRYQHSPAFFVSRRLSNQDLTAGGATRAIFDTALINDSGCFDFGASAFVCPRAGRMFIGGQAFIGNNTATAGHTFLKISVAPSNLQGLGALVGSTPLAPNTNDFLNGNFFVEVSVGSNVSMEVFSFGTPLTMRPVGLGEESCYMYGYYLP